MVFVLSDFLQSIIEESMFLGVFLVLAKMNIDPLILGPDNILRDTPETSIRQH